MRDEQGRFIKGQTGNPGGRPATPNEVKEMLRAAVAPSIKLLIDTVNNKNARLDLRIKSAETIIDRVYGRAVQPLALDAAPTIDLSDVSIDDLRRLAANYDEPEKTGNSENGEA